MLSNRGRRCSVGWLLPVAAVALYALMWLGYRQGWSWLDGADSAAIRAGYDVGVKHPGWVWFWDGVCTVFAPSTFRLLAIAAVVIALVQHRVRTALLVLVSVEFSGLVAQSAKDLADRPRPVTALVDASSSSFPSGHAVGAMVGVLALLVVLLPALGRRTGVAAIAAGTLVAVMVGLGRVALNVHHPSDVVAGWALGYLYFTVCARLLAPQPRRRLTGDDGSR